tara:strand:+ start:1241 stop:2710 length:1470 start_codon:yes stop_codon:yes gene_type:complete
MAIEPYPIQECINDTNDKFYSYRKVTFSNGVIRYYFKGKNIHAKFEKSNRKNDIVGFDPNNPKLLLSYYFPDWFEAGVKKKTYPTDYYANEIEDIPGPKGFYYWNKKSGNAIKNLKKWVCQDIPAPLMKIKTKGIVVDFNTNEPLSNVTVSFRGNSTTTDVDGHFKIEVDKPKNQIEAKAYQLFFNKSKYLINSTSPYKGNGEVKSDVGVITLMEIKKPKFPQIQLDIPEIEVLTLPEKDTKYWSKEKILQILKEVLQRLLPIIQAMLLEFGMKLLNEKFEEMKDKVSCPSKEKLEELVNKKNKLVRQINNLMKTIDGALKFLGFTEGILTIAEVSVKSINATPVPTPPIVPFTVTQLEAVIETSNSIISSTTSLLTILRTVLDQVLTPLNQLDMLIQQCYPDADQVQLSEELQVLTKESQSPKITIVNGFTMDIEQEITEKPLKRKRAIAKDTSGVTVLKGEWSFSSIDQILIDELVFYIQTNDLKAD